VVTRARASDSLHAFARLARRTGGEPRIRDDPPFVVPLSELGPADELDATRQQIARYLRTYTRTLEPHRRQLHELHPDELTTSARLCGWTLAPAHARTRNRTAIAAYLGRSPTFGRPVVVCRVLRRSERA
jgi:hypothetical protein